MSAVGTSYPLLDAFWTILWLVAFFIWIYAVIRVFMDIFRSRDMSGWGKAGWTILVFALPLLGVLIYLIARGDKMQQNEMADQMESEISTQKFIRQSMSPTAISDEAEKLTSLHDSGLLSDDEYKRLKAQLG